MAALLTNATERGWGNPGRPGSSAGTKYRKANIVTFTVPFVVGGGKVSLSTHRDAAAIFYAAVHDASTVFDFNNRADDWSYAHRVIRGSTSGRLSNHSWGLAIDLDATQNPQQKRVKGKPVRRTITDQVVAIMARYGLFWGGNYTTTPDPMHFEVMLTRAQARVLGAKLVAEKKAPKALAPK